MLVSLVFYVLVRHLFNNLKIIILAQMNRKLILTFQNLISPATFKHEGNICPLIIVTSFLILQICIVLIPCHPTGFGSRNGKQGY